MRIFFSRLYWMLIFTLFVMTCLLAILLGTPKGASFLVHKSSEISGQRIHINHLDGTILGGLKADNITFSDKPIVLQIQQAEFKLSFRELLSKEIRIQKLKAKRVKVRLPAQNGKPQDQPKKIELPEFSSPLKLDMDSLEVGTLTLQTGNKTQIYKDINISGVLHQSTLTIRQLHCEVQGYHVNILGNFSFLNPFPLSFKINLTDKNGSTLHAQINGTIKYYQLVANANINTPHLPPFTAQIRSHGNIDHLNVDKLVTQALDNTITMTGKIDWKEKLKIKTRFSAAKINPESIIAKFPGNISLTGKASFMDQTLDTKLSASGQLRGIPVDVKTQISLHKKILDIHTAKAFLGENTITLKGTVSSQQASKIKYRIDAPNLNAFHPELNGNLTANGRLDGPWNTVRIASIIKGENISFGSQHIKSLNLELQPTSLPGKHKLNLLAKNIILDNRPISSLSVKGNGNKNQQSLYISLQGGPFGTMFNANLNGQLDLKRQYWAGEINSLQLSATDIPDYRQKKSANIFLSRTKQKISKLCLHGPYEKLCFKSDINLGKHSIISASLKQLPLKRFTPWASFSKNLKEHLSSELKIVGDQQHWQVDASGKLDLNNQIKTRISINQGENEISGNISAKFNKLQWLNLFTEEITQPKGRLVANIKLSGITTQPTLLGTIKLEGGAVRVPLTGTEITKTNLLIDLQPRQTAKLSGEFKSGNGKMILKGIARWPDAPHWNTDIHLSGRNFLATDLPIARVNISPEIHITGTQKAINVSGTLSIPKANIKIEDLPDTAIKPSPDEKIIDGSTIKPQPLATDSVLAINADVGIRLGTEINLQGFGLDTRIEGGLKLHKRPGKPINGDGILHMVDGKYSAYGKELSIEQGALYFNGPLDAPRMNLRVINPIKNIKVGLAITGSPQNPESRVFSTPPMPETEALSYLLTGKPLGSTGESESGMLVNAAAKLGMKKSANRINAIRAKAGFDTLKLEAGDDLTESELVVGKYLSARLYLEYITQLFSSSEIFALRYEFSDKLHLEAESGADAQALDLIYQFEK